jgi:hypothetical protein
MNLIPQASKANQANVPYAQRSVFSQEANGTKPRNQTQQVASQVSSQYRERRAAECPCALPPNPMHQRV